MDYKDLTSLLVRLAGLVMVVLTVADLPNWIPPGMALLRKKSFLECIFVVGVPLIIPLLVGASLAFFPRSIANKIIRADNLPPEPAGILPQLEQVAFGVLGMYLLFRGLSDMVFHLSEMLFLQRQASMAHVKITEPILTPTKFGYLVATVGEIVFAVWLLVGTKGVLGVVRRLRSQN